ncbi:hypothetical protein DV737_g3000, partial [Chaetothyriales sp. CBS 132003]
MATYVNLGPVKCETDFDTSSLKGKTVIITGGANGIGEAYAKSLVAAGAFVVFGDIDADAANKVEADLKPSAKWIKCDVTKWDDQLDLFKQALALSPNKRIDIVIANAGIAGLDDAFDTNSEKDEPEEPKLNILKVNGIGVLYTTKLALFYFRRQYAADPAASKNQALILQGSLAGYVDLKGSLQYSFTKYGLRSLMKNMRHTEPAHGIRVNYIGPWFVKTNILGRGIAERLEEAGFEFATLEDTATAMLKIASDPSINGRSLAVVPRRHADIGYLDLDLDDYKEGGVCKVLNDETNDPCTSSLTIFVIRVIMVPGLKSFYRGNSVAQHGQQQPSVSSAGADHWSQGHDVAYRCPYESEDWSSPRDLPPVKTSIDLLGQESPPSSPKERTSITITIPLPWPKKFSKRSSSVPASTRTRRRADSATNPDAHITSPIPAAVHSPEIHHITSPIPAAVHSPEVHHITSPIPAAVHSPEIHHITSPMQPHAHSPSLYQIISTAPPTIGISKQIPVPSARALPLSPVNEGFARPHSADTAYNQSPVTPIDQDIQEDFDAATLATATSNSSIVVIQAPHRAGAGRLMKRAPYQARIDTLAQAGEAGNSYSAPNNKPKPEPEDQAL